MTTAHLQRIRDLVNGDIQFLGQLIRARATLVLLLKLREGLGDLVQRAHLVQWQTHDTALLGQGLQDALANPPYGIGDKLETARLVELLSGLDEAEVTLVDQVGKAQTLVLVLLGHTDHETQIRTSQLLQGYAVTLADALCQFYFFLHRNQVLAADFLKIFVQGSALAVGDTLGNF